MYLHCSWFYIKVCVLILNYYWGEKTWLVTCVRTSFSRTSSRLCSFLSRASAKSSGMSEGEDRDSKVHSWTANVIQVRVHVCIFVSNTDQEGKIPIVYPMVVALHGTISRCMRVVEPERSCRDAAAIRERGYLHYETEVVVARIGENVSERLIGNRYVSDSFTRMSERPRA